VQEKNVNLSVYKIPKRKGIMESDLLDYTRAYFPSMLFDTAFITDNYVFGKKGDTYCTFIGSNNFVYRDSAMDDIIQQGKHTFWITEAGSVAEDGTFDAFVERIQNNPLQFNAKKHVLNYQSRGIEYNLKFGGDFMVDGNVVDTNYSRYESPYASAEKKDDTLTFEKNGKTLYLDFNNLVRKF
jgi:hypothetical protein